MGKQKKYGTLLSYLNIFLNLFVNLFLTPVLISAWSDDMYSIYKIMHSFAGPLMMLNLGMSTIVGRSIAKYRVDTAAGSREKENTLAMTMLVSALMAVLVVLVSLVMRGQIPRLYAKNYTSEELVMAQNVFFIFAISTSVHVLTDVFRGCIAGNERFIFSNGIQALRHVLKFGLTFICVKLGYGIIVAALVELVGSLFYLAAAAWFSLGRLKERPKFHYFDAKEVSGMVAFSVSILLQTIVGQVNNNVDTIILGAMVSSTAVITMYASALSIYTMYSSLLSVFSGLLFPEVTKMVVSGASGKELTDYLIKPGRYQVVIATGILGGFALFGKNFIEIWIGNCYIDAYYVALILMVPLTIPLVQNVCVTVLDAQLKRLFRSVVLVIMAVLNVVFSIIAVRYMDFWGAAVVTALSYIIGHIIAMNIYYQKVVGIQVIRMFREMFRGIVPMGIVAALICLPLAVFLENTIALFLVKCIVFVVVYALLLWKRGLNESEKNLVKRFLKR